MTYPEKYQSIRRTSGDLPLSVETATETLPKELGPNDVVIKIHAVSLNFRDVGMLHGRYPIEVIERGIVASDCAAEVVAVGQAVKDFKLGDHVAPVFDLNDLDRDVDESVCALGGDVDGVLREYAVFEAKQLVQLPKYLSWEEVCSHCPSQLLWCFANELVFTQASTLPCAGVTAWTSLNFPSETSGKNMSALFQG